MTNTMDLAIGTDTYSPDFVNGRGHDYFMTSDKFNANFPNGIICPCSGRTYLTRAKFSKHCESAAIHKNWLLKLEEPIKDTEIKKRYLASRKENNELRERIETLEKENEELKKENREFEDMGYGGDALKEEISALENKHSDECVAYEGKIEKWIKKYERLAVKYKELEQNSAWTEL